MGNKTGYSTVEYQAVIKTNKIQGNFLCDMKMSAQYIVK